jgi:type IV secretory pathway VirB10-like protein
MKTSAIKSILIIAGAGLGAALIGLLGTYFVLPEVAPRVTAEAETEEQAEAPPDSAVTRTPRPDSSQSPPTAAQTPPEQTTSRDEASADQEPSPSEAQEEAEDRPEATASAQSSSSAETASQEPEETAAAQALRDSLRTLQRRLQETKKEARALRKETETLRQKVAAADAERAKVDELSNALMDMRRRPLTNLLKKVNMSVLKKLYQQTTGTARTRLLQSLAPAQAAKFVNQVLEGDVSVSSDAPAAPDSTLASK